MQSSTSPWRMLLLLLRPSVSGVASERKRERGVTGRRLEAERLGSLIPLLVFAVACGANAPDAIELGAPVPANDNSTPGAAPGDTQSGDVESSASGEAAAGTGATTTGAGSDNGTLQREPNGGALTGSEAGTNDEPAPADALSDGSGSDGDEGSQPGRAEPDGAGDSDGAAGNGSAGALIRGADPTPQSATSRGPFQIQTFSDGLRDGPQYGTQTLHYPTDAEPPFAAVAVVPGFTAPESSIRSWGPFLASHGIVALTIGTNSPSDSPEARAQALLDALATIKAENTRSNSPLAGNIDVTRLGVMGWSMGGGGTLIASNAHPELKAAITLAAWSPGERFSDDQVPTLLFAGSADTLAGGQSQGFFASIPATTPKMLYEVDGGSHSVANNPNGAGGEVGRYGLSWLKVFLEGDERYRQFLLVEPTRDSAFLQNLTDGS